MSNPLLGGAATAMLEPLDQLMSNVTRAIFDAEEGLEQSLQDWEVLEAAEQAIADHPLATPLDKAIANRGVGYARTKITVLRAILDTKFDEKPRKRRTELDAAISRLITWRANCSDLSGSDLIGHVLFQLREARPHPSLPTDYLPALEAFRKLPRDQQREAVEEVLPGDVDDERHG